jgi:A/G-specific adenine glycosylase
LKKLIIKGMDKRYFSDKIVKWYLVNKRDLPWRESKDPYKIWLSEIILQQTRVNQGRPYYERFVDRYPTIRSLANAAEQEVLRLWQGLGYYTRARNLHKCAKTVVTHHGGEFPRSFEGLRTLPGVGAYTAAAVASIAYGAPVAVVDGNVFRVLSRIFGIHTPINSPQGKKEFTDLANDLVDTGQPDLHNQAVMEFGALFCTPQNPACDNCMFQKSCFAFQNKLQAFLPVKRKAKASRTRYFYYIVREYRKQLAMRKRDEKDIWFGLYDFELIERKRKMSAEKILKEASLKKIVTGADSIVISKDYKHVLTHQTIFSRFIIVRSATNIKTHDFYSLKQIMKLPKPVLISKFLADHYVS